jgi:transposase
MQLETSNLKFADITIRNYINEIKNNYEQQIVEIKTQFDEQIKTLNANLLESENKYLVLKEQYDLLIYRRFGRSAEQLLRDEKQPLLFTEEGAEKAECEEEKHEEFQKVKSFQRRKGGRKPISPSLSRRERIIDISESEKTCACGAKLVKIGEETSEKVEIIPCEIYVDKIVRPKYACRCCEGTGDEGKSAVRIAPVEPSIIPKGIASPSLLSTIITQKFEMHLPYYRQEKQFEYIGIILSRQDMSNWQQQVYKKLTFLFMMLKAMVKSWPVIQMDETTVQVIGEEGREDTQKSYMWVTRGGPPGKKVIWYEYHTTRAAYHAKEFLEGYSGYLQTDGYKGYVAAVKEMAGIIQVGCFAHARRKFFEAAKAGKEGGSAQIGITFIRKLYEIEKKLRSQWEEDKQTEKFLIKRKDACEPVLAKFRAWLIKRKDEVPESTSLGKAINYSLGQWDKLVRYLESPYLTPDNNACENAIRPFVIGRKNWLFSQSPDGADSSAGMYTLIETAKQNGLVPYKYLMALFEKAPFASSTEDWEKLLPWNVFQK